MTDTLFTVEKHTYTCDAGHSFTVNGTWTTFAVSFQDKTIQTYTYNYCPLCFGQWALKKWPLTEQVKP